MNESLHDVQRELIRSLEERNELYMRQVELLKGIIKNLEGQIEIYKEAEESFKRYHNGIKRAFGKIDD